MSIIDALEYWELPIWLKNGIFTAAAREDAERFTYEEEQRWADEARKLEEEQEYNG